MMESVNDTSLEAEQIQLELLRAMSPAERLSLMDSLTQHAIFLSKRAIARVFPESSERERNIQFVELHYGKTLADGLRRYWEEQENAGRGTDPSPSSSDRSL